MLSMDSHSLTYIFILILLIILSAYFSATETAFSSLNMVRIKNFAQGGDKKAKRVYKLLGKYDELLSTILVGNNIVNIASTAIATVLFISLIGDMGATLSTIVMTLIVLIFGEVTPKSMAKESPEDFAMFSAPFVQVLMVVFKPLNFCFSALQKLLKRIFKVGNKHKLTDSELLTIVEEAEQEGGINTDESELIRNVIEFDDITAEEILTPRVDVVAVPISADNDTVAELFTKTGYSRLPVYKDSIDYIIGIIHEKNFYAHVWKTEKTIHAIIKPVEFVPPTIKILSLMKQLQNNKVHMAVVVDEFGGTEGIVTLEDVIEELVGDIWDEHDAIASKSFIKQPNGSYRIFCSTDLEELFEFFHLDMTSEASSINGWVMEHFDEIPEKGEMFEVHNIQFVVSKIENNRVLEIEAFGEPLEDTEDDAI